MGCGASSPADGGDADGGPMQVSVSYSKKVEDELERAKNDEEGKVKLLLLGAGESGKSTVFKQMRIIYGSARDDNDLKMFGVVCRSNTVTAIRKLCIHLRNLGLEASIDEESAKIEEGAGMTPRQAYDELIAHLVDNTAPPQAADAMDENDWVGKVARAGPSANKEALLFLAHHKSIKALWESDTMKEVWSKRSAVNVIDAHKEFLQDTERLASPNYRPTTQDVLIARVRTTQVIVEKYRIDGIEFEMYDVGGQRSERRKWIDCFEGVDAVIFVAALSEYDQCLAEAKHTNRMVEAIELFRSICNNRAFANTSIMLFLNKKDIFAEKIMTSDIAAQRPFADYSGPPRDMDQGVLYFIQKFKDCLIDEEFNDSFIHVTCATDTNNMEFVLESTRMIIMTDSLKESGILG